MLNVAIINSEYDDRFGPRELLDHYFLLTGWAEGVRAAGARVTVFQRSRCDGVVQRSGVRYELIADRLRPRMRGWHIPWRLHRSVRRRCRAWVLDAEPTVVHLNGLIYPFQTRYLRSTLPSRCALAVQHHAERPRPGFRGLIQGWSFQKVDGFLFTNRELSAEWLKRGIIRSPADVYEVMECSSPLFLQQRGAARSVTGMTGDPVILWTGNLTANKDPLTILAGFEMILQHHASARLYIAYRRTDLLDRVKQAIAEGGRLRQSVVLLGEIPYPEIADYYNSADLFVQGSAREGSGVAVLDALACGVVPVVTDIPSFRTLLDGGRVGALWRLGDAEEFARAALRVMAAPLAPQREAARKLFERRWSYPVIGRRAVEVYQAMIARRGEDLRPAAP